MIKEAFGEQLRKVRRKQDLTQHEIALRCKMSLRFYQDMEAGNKQPTLTTLFRLCTAIGIAPDKLILPVWKSWQVAQEK